MTWMDDLALDRWDVLAPERRRQCAERVGRLLPPGFSLISLQRYAMGDQAHEMAMYEGYGGRFALIPGGRVPLGYLRGSFQPTPALEEAWYQGICDFTGTPMEEARANEEMSLEASFDQTMSPLRHVVLSPYLIETTARGAQPKVGLQRKLTYDDLAAMASRDGCRLPTSDEWEHARSGGSRTLWRWGDECPLDELPIEDHEFVGGKWRPIPLRWQLHRKPNAFGLVIADESYNWEAVREEGVLRGGDGGSAICGGCGAILGWLPLATAYIQTEQSDMYSYAFFRRVYPLAEVG